MVGAARRRGMIMMKPEAILGLAERLRQVHLPVCPQMRPRCTLWSQVEGYCASDSAPGWLMLPDVDEFHAYCTTGRYHDCPWFGGLRDGMGEVARLHPRTPALTGSQGLAGGREPGNKA